MFNTNLKRYCLVFLLCMAVSVTANAQSSAEGAIAGTIFDTNSAVVAGASVLIHNDGTNAETALTSDGSGYFKQPLVQPGVYTVTVKAPGFKDYKATSVVVEVGKLTELQPHLPVGTAGETVTVSTDAPIMNYESPEISSNLSEKAIDGLPVNGTGRRWSSYALLTPGVTLDTSGFGLLSFRGISTLFNNVEIDGADDNNAFWSEERGRTREGYSTAQAAIKEFQVNTGVFQAEYGRAAGGVVNAVTKSGSNQIHGELYFYDRDNDWGAFNPYSLVTPTHVVGGLAVPIPGAALIPFKPTDWRKQWGFGIGGPIIKDKLFWFYAYDQFRRNFPGIALPSGLGSGSGATGSPQGFYSIPNQSAPANGGTCSTQAVGANGWIPNGPGGAATPIDLSACTLAARLGITYAAAAALWQTDTDNIIGGDFGTVPRVGNQEINTPKLDWQITPKEHATLLYHRLNWDAPGDVETNTINAYGKGTWGTDVVKLNYGLATLESLITSSISNELRYQYSRELLVEGLQPQTAYDTTNFGNGSAYLPEVGVANGSGGSNYGANLGSPYFSFRKALPDERKWQAADTVNWVHGNHTFKAGADILHNYDINNALFDVNGNYSYTQLGNYFADLTSKGGASTCDQNGTKYPTGPTTVTTGTYSCYLTYTQGTGPAAFDMGTTSYGFFAQDTYKATPRLTLDLGVRYDYQSIPSAYALAPNANFNLINAAIPGSTNRPNDKNNIGPRLGFAYDAFGTGKTVVRGGYGLYYGSIPLYFIMDVYFNSGGAAAQNTTQFTVTTANAPKFPNAISGTGISAPATVAYLSSNYQNPMVNEFDLAVQQDIGHGTVLSLSYLGALGRELPNEINVNLDPTKKYNETITVTPNAQGQYGPLGPSYTASLYSTSVTTFSGGVAQPATPTYLNPAYAAIIENVSDVNSSYHALVAEVENKTYKMIQFDANYTWSHALDFAQNAVTTPSTSSNWYDPYGNPRANYGPSIYNIPNRFVGWVMFNSTFHYTDWRKYVLNGWVLNPLVQAQTGLPYSMTVGALPAQCTASLATPTCYKAGNSGLNGSGATFITGPGVPNLRNAFHYPYDIVADLRAEKDFTLFGKYNLQLIGEGFNIINHQNVTSISTTTGYSFTAASGTGAGTGAYVTPYAPGSFGSTNGTGTTDEYTPRQIQLAVRLLF